MAGKVLYRAAKVKGWVENAAARTFGPIVDDTLSRVIYLCLDIGTRRTGVAISDSIGMLARPLGRFPGGEGAEALADRLRDLVHEHQVGAIVIGLPRRLSGEHGPEADNVTSLAQGLGERLDVPVRLWDERLSTVEAQRLMIEAGVRRKRRKAVVDAIAATVILQSYLDSLPSPLATDAAS